MNTASAIPTPAAAAGAMRDDNGIAAPIGGGESGFDTALASARNAGSEDELRTSAEELVSHGFIQPLMKMMREDPFKTDLFHGGSGEDMFAQQLDQQLAGDMVSGMKLPIVDAVYDRFAGYTQKGPTAAAGGKVDHHG